MKRKLAAPPPSFEELRRLCHECDAAETVRDHKGVLADRADARFKEITDKAFKVAFYGGLSINEADKFWSGYRRARARRARTEAAFREAAYQARYALEFAQDRYQDKVRHEAEEAVGRFAEDLLTYDPWPAIIDELDAELDPEEREVPEVPSTFIDEIVAFLSDEAA